MPTDASFRFSTYLTLALTCLVLGYAEHEILPEVPVFAVLSVLALGVLFFLESRVRFLSIPAANRLGMAIGLVYLMWSAYRIKREIDTSEFINMGWHMLIVALCGPLVMLAVVAKMARSDKHAGDYWTLHGIALAGVGLSAALAEEPACFVLIGLYLAAAVWSLTLLHLGRARGAIPPIPGGKQPATKAIAVSADPTGHRTDLRPALGWVFMALALAVPLYLLTPRSDASKADFGKPRIEIGYAADQMVDLNRTGPLKVNTETAFEFTATYPDGSPKTDMSPEQRWYGKTHRLYAGGEWKPMDTPPLPITPLARREEVWTPPNLGPGQFTIQFDVPAKLRGVPIADPVIWAPDQPPPLAVVTDAGPRGWLPVSDGSFFWEPSVRTRGAPRRYIQVYRKMNDPDAGPPFQFREANLESALAPIRQNPVPRVKEYADRILKDLVSAGEIPAGYRDAEARGGSLLPKPEYHDLIARKFAAYLATTPTLTYTTDLRRQNLRVDPIEDFLYSTKSGHCERFAGALVLMLRSQGIPAVYVLGFKGCEYQGNGKYIVRQEHAHAWVEALVPKPGVAFRPHDPRNVYHWRSLDPTPAGVAVEDEEKGWFTKANAWMESHFQDYVTNYTPEQRRKALADLVSRLTQLNTIVGIVAVVMLAFGVRFAHRQLARRSTPAPGGAEQARWFGELVAVLAASGIVPAAGDTPLEFATTATAVLRERPTCESVAEVPIEWAIAYYQDRFGGVPISDARIAELEAGLAALRAALAQSGG
jgi:transglutaminase-like putative cysteine protease